MPDIHNAESVQECHRSQAEVKALQNGEDAVVCWCDKLYYSHSLKYRSKTRRSIENGEAVKDVFCIAFASNEANLFDIIPAKELLYPHYVRSCVKVVGLAESREAAVILVKDMIKEMYVKTGDFRVRDYFR